MLRASTLAPPRGQLLSASSEIADSPTREEAKGTGAGWARQSGGCDFDVGGNQGVGLLAPKRSSEAQALPSLLGTADHCLLREGTLGVNAQKEQGWSV